MLAVIHALVGGLIGEEFHSIILIAIASFALHFLFDMFPHWDANWDKKRFETTGEAVLSRFAKVWFILDHILAIAIIIYLANTFESKKVLLGAFIGVVPDWIGLGYKTKLRKNKHYMKFLNFHSKIQKHTGFKKSIISQLIIMSILAIIFIIIYKF
jgi:hypothetical protein